MGQPVYGARPRHQPAPQAQAGWPAYAQPTMDTAPHIQPDYIAPRDYGRAAPPLQATLHAGPKVARAPLSPTHPSYAQPQAGHPRYHPEPDLQPWDLDEQEPYPSAPHPSAPRVNYAAPPAWLGPRSAPHAAAQGQAYAPSAPKPARPPVQPAALAHGFGAVLSLGLVVLAAGWTWQMMQRDVSGVPVVRALEGPMRVAPDNPGGTQAAFQGLAVNQLAGTGHVDEPDVIVLAPAPAGLGGAAPTATGSTELAAAPVLLDGPPLGFRNPSRLAVERSPRPRGRDTSALAAGGLLAQASPAQAAQQAPSLSTSNDLQGVDALAASIADSVASGLAGPRGVDIDPASIGPGTRLVQLGAFDSPEEARGAWDVLKRRFSPLLDDRGRVIEAAHSGGSVFYRLRAHGFGDERDARRFCAALVAEQVDCIPVLVR